MTSMNAQAIAAKQPDRDRLHYDTEAFIRSGGKVTTATPSEYSRDPLPVRVEGARNGWENRA